MAYTTVTQVGNAYGAPLTDAQSIQATEQMAAAEALIDAHTGRRWVASPVVAITSEAHALAGPEVVLRAAPVTSVQAVRAYSAASPTARALVAQQDYWLTDAARGRLTVAAWPAYARVEVDYTPAAGAATVPPEVQEATAVLLAHWLSEPGGVGTGAVTGLTLGETRVQWAAPAPDASGSALPARVRALLSAWHLPVLA